jgi:hypothetical protein
VNTFHFYCYGLGFKSVEVGPLSLQLLRRGAMQHEDPPPLGEHAPNSNPLDHSAVLLALWPWPSLCTDDRRALRLCCSTMRDAVDAQAGRVEQGQGESSPVLCPATCARLHSVHTATIRSMDCLRRMLLVAPAGAVFPRLQSLRLHLVGFAPMHARLVCHVASKHHARLT